MKPIQWLRVSLAVLITAILACATIVPPTSVATPGVAVLEAQTLPYTLTVAWNASPDAATYNCYLDGVKMTAVPGTALTCQFPVSTTGLHTVGVTAVNPAFVPSESAQGSLAFSLKTPTPPTGLSVK